MFAADDLVEKEIMRDRFTRLIKELARGSVTRTAFQPWEIDILLDLDSHEMKPRQRADMLRRYLKAVGKQLDNGPGPPMTLSAYLTSVAHGGHPADTVLLSQSEALRSKSDAPLEECG